MEIDYNHDIKSLSEAKIDKGAINVRAIITCPNCDYEKTFKNQFHVKKMEEMIVCLKCFDWLTCSCGEIVQLNLEFDL